MKKRVLEGGILTLAAAVTLAMIPCLAGSAQNTAWAGSRRSITVETQSQLDKALKSKGVKSVTIKSGSKSLTIPKSVKSSASVRVNAKKLKITVKGKTGNLTVQNAALVKISGTAPTVSLPAAKSSMIVSRGAQVKKLNISGSGNRVLNSSGAAIRSSGKFTNVQLRRGAEKSDVTLQGGGAVSSVMNNTSSDVDLNVNEDNNNLHAGAVYTGSDPSEGTQTSPLPNNNPLRNYQALVNDGALSLEIHGCGRFSHLSSTAGVHGWYYNSATGTAYECYFHVSGGKITTEYLRNPNWEKNYKGEASFSIVNVGSSSMTIRSSNDIYGDKGTEYTLPFDADTEQFDPSKAVDPTNPMSQFSGAVISDGLILDIHGSGEYSYMSSGNTIHGWYYNRNTESRFQCRFNRKGNKIHAKYLSNKGHLEWNYRGDPDFEIVDYGDGFLKLKSTNNYYGDEGHVYTFVNCGTPGAPVNADNPLKIFSDRVTDGDLSLIIHGSGKYSNVSYGNSIHGWYYNLATGTEYQCRFNIAGSYMEVDHVTCSTSEKNYLGNAEFQILAHDDHSITVKSMNNIYGDEGQVYTFSTDGQNENEQEEKQPVDASNPLYPFTGQVSSGELSLDIHGSGTFSYLSHGNKIHGWYKNTATGAQFECRFIVDGSSIRVVEISNNPYNKGYLGEASFVIVSDTDNALTLQSSSDTYGDKGQTYVFYKPGHEPAKSGSQKDSGDQDKAGSQTTTGIQEKSDLQENTGSQEKTDSQEKSESQESSSGQSSSESSGSGQ